MKKPKAKPAAPAESYEVIIAGAGAAGLALAVLLGRKGCPVALIDKGPAPSALDRTEASGRTVALMQSSLEVLKACDVLDRLRPFGGAMKTMRLIDDSGPRLLPGGKLDFLPGEAGFDLFGLNVPVTQLRAALWEKAAATPCLTLMPGTGLAGFEASSGSVLVALEDGRTLRGKLLVGADGARSIVREQAGISCHVRAYGRKAITCLIAHSRPHLNVSTEFHRPSGPFAIVPLPGDLSSIVWVEPDAQADALFALPPDAFRAALQDKTGGLVGDISVRTPPEIWPLRALKARRLTGPRMALIAEAAHTMSPITAQGLNLSLRDVADLAGLVTTHRALGMDPGGPATLQAYERARRLDILTRTTGVDTLMRLVSTDRVIPRIVRRGAMQAVGRISPLRLFFIKYGMGLPLFSTASSRAA